MSVGYVYILSNPTMPRLLKIGYMLDDVDRRAQELYRATGVPQPFEVEFWCLTLNPESVEQMVHERLNSHRVNDGREFFLVDIETAVLAIRDAATLPPAEFRKPKAMDRLSPLWTCRRCGHNYKKTEMERFCPKCGF
jgi:hypothetical protein